MPRKIRNKPGVTINTPITEHDIKIIGKTVRELEKEHHIKFKKVNGKKPNPKHILRSGEQIEISGTPKNAYDFWK